MTSEPDYDAHLSQSQFLLRFQKWQIIPVLIFLINTQWIPTDGVWTLIKSSTDSDQRVRTCACVSWYSHSQPQDLGERHSTPPNLGSLSKINKASLSSLVHPSFYKLFPWKKCAVISLGFPEDLCVKFSWHKSRPIQLQRLWSKRHSSTGDL